jgi:hypothetical protein
MYDILAPTTALGESACHVPNVVKLPDRQFLHVIGEFNYPLWNAAINEPALGFTDTAAASASSGSVAANERHFLGKLSHSPQTALTFYLCLLHNR